MSHYTVADTIPQESPLDGGATYGVTTHGVGAKDPVALTIPTTTNVVFINSVPHVQHIAKPPALISPKTAGQ